MTIPADALLSEETPRRDRELGAPPSRPGAERWWSGAALVVAVVTPFLAYIANLGLASLVALAGFACLAAIRSPRTWPWGLWALAGLVAWAVISYAWSPLSPTLQPKGFKRLDAITGLKLVLELGLYGAFVAAMSRIGAAGARRALNVLTIGLALLLAMLLVEAFTNVAVYRAARDAVGLHAREDFPIHHIARGCYIAVVLFWPAAFGLLRRKGWEWAAVGLWALTLASCVLLHVDSPTVALVASTAVIFAVRFLGPPAVWACTGLLIAYLLLGPLVFALTTRAIAPDGVSALGKASWGARAEIWRFVSTQIAHRPLFGWGLDASRSWPDDIPLHPHDAALQLWLELGAVGALLADSFVVWLMIALARLAATDRPLAAIGTACVSAYAVIGALSFGVWQEWWIATGAIGAAACFWFGRGRLLDPPPRRPAAARPRRTPLQTSQTSTVAPYLD